MRIDGLQKLTLLDYPGKMACTIFLGGCNFRCPFCHNSELLTLDPGHPPAYTEEGILAFLKKRVGILDGVCITGGEPLLTDDVRPFMEKIKEMGFQIKLDTNGSYPKRLKGLVQAGLVDYVAMDIKNSPKKYGATVGRPAFDLAPINESVAYLLSGAVDCEFRTTVVKEYHEAEDFAAMGQWLKGAKEYYLQAYKDSDGVLKPGFGSYTLSELQAFRKILKETISLVEIRGIE